MKHPGVWGILWLVMSVSIDAQERVSLFHVASPSESAMQHLSQYVDDAVVVKLHRNAAVEALVARAAALSFDLPLSATESLTIPLQAVQVMAPGGRVVAGTDQGDEDVDMRSQYVVYSSSAWDMPRRARTLMITPREVMGLFEVDGDFVVLGSLAKVAGFTDDDYVVYRTASLKTSGEFVCGTEAFETPNEVVDAIARVRSGNAEHHLGVNDVLVSNMAIEADYQTFVRHGNSVEQTASNLLFLVSCVSALYLRDINVQIVVPYLRVWTTAGDPYTDNPSGSDVLLNEFRNYWNVNMQSVTRTTAHFISTRNQGLGGIAWLNVLCASVSSGYGYAFSDIQLGNHYPLPGYSWEVMVIAHETGHNFGSPHTHNCSWNPPIDTCYMGSETAPCYSGSCPVNTVCVPRLGTIMSYCHLTSAGTALYFGPLPSNLIRVRAEAAACMLPNSAGLILGYPNGGEEFKTQTSRTNPAQTIITWGADFTGQVDIQYSIDGGAAWIPIATVPSDQREYVWTIPYIQTTDEALIRISNTSVPSQADTSQSTFTIRLQLWQITSVSPPNKAQIHVAADDYSPVTFTWTSAGTHPDIINRFYLRRKSNPIPAALWDAGPDTSFTLLAHDLDSVLTSWNAWVSDSVQCYWYGVAYNGEDSVRSGVVFQATIRREGTVGIEDGNGRPMEFALLGNHPNPFNPTTTIHYQLPSDGWVRLRIYNTLGQEIRSLANETQSAGRRSIVWDGVSADGSAVASGIYIYTMEVESMGKTYRASRKMIMTK